jgi:SAM-dependent methyltransferase
MITSQEPIDTAGAETLEIMSEAQNYNQWQFDRIAPFLGSRICEIGSGIGNMSARLVSDRRELALLTDPDPAYLRRLRTRFSAMPKVRVERLALPDDSAGERFRDLHLDTVIALNVVEHNPQDREALATMVSLVGQRGRVVVLVPAFPILYGSLDRELGHVRRYSKALLARMLEEAGCRVDSVFYFNLIGAGGWWVNSRLRRAKRIPLGQLRWFDRMVPLLRIEDALPLPFGQSVIGIGTVR